MAVIYAPVLLAQVTYRFAAGVAEASKQACQRFLSSGRAGVGCDIATLPNSRVVRTCIQIGPVEERLGQHLGAR